MSRVYREPPGPAPLAVVAFGRHVFGLERATGRRVWHWSSRAGVWSRLAITDDRVVVGGGNALVCLAYATGAVLWQSDSPVRSTDAFVVDGDNVLVGAAGEVACFALETGRLLWHEAFSGLGIPAVALGFPGNVSQVDHSG